MNPEGVRRVRLHVVTDDEVLSRTGWMDLAISVLEAGGNALALHLRGPGLPGSTMYRLADRLVARTEGTNAALVINDRLDVALALGVGAVHLGTRSLTVAAARRVAVSTGVADLTVGVSCHSAADLVAAAALGADYAFLGTVKATPSHAGRIGIGAEGLRAGVSAIEGLPVVGIGGMTPESVGDVVAAGAHGVAVLRGVWDADRPDRAVSEYLMALSRAVGVAHRGNRGHRE